MLNIEFIGRGWGQHDYIWCLLGAFQNAYPCLVNWIL